MEIFIKVSSWIVAPIVGALLLGRYLDNRFQTKPWIFLGLTALAFVISMFGILKETMIYMKELEKELQEKKEKEGGSSDKIN